MGKYVIGIGEALWDVLPEGKKLGGAPANFAYHARQFGLEGIAVSAIGRDALGEDRELTIARELTKRYEEKLQFTFGEAIDYYDANEPRGEYVLVIAGKSKEELARENEAKWENLSLSEHMKIYLDKGSDKKQAMKSVAKDRGVSKRDIYNQIIQEENNED